MAINKYYEDHNMIPRRTRLQRLLKDMKELREEIKQPCRLRHQLLLFSVSLLTIFQSSSAAVSGLYDNDLVIISNCSVGPQTNCPTARELIAFREQCINGFERDICPAGTTYLCGVVPGYFIETCAVDKECWPGTSFNFVIRNGTVTVECVRCPDGTFETEHRKTSQSNHIPGCTYRHIPQDEISSNLVLFKNGTHATAAIYRCKTEEGFYEENGNKFCDDIPTYGCKCIFKHCQTGYQLHPIGYCVRCKKALRPENDWRCEDHISDQTTKSIKYITDYSTISGSNVGGLTTGSLKTTPGQITGNGVTKVTHPPGDVGQGTTGDAQTASDWGYISIGIVAGVLIAAVSSISLFLIYKRRSKTAYVKQKGHVYDKRVSYNKIYKFRGCRNVLFGKGNTMNNMESPLSFDSPCPEEINKYDGSTLQDNYKLHKFDSEPSVQDNDIDQTERKEVDDSLP